MRRLPHDVCPDKAQVGRVSVLTKRQVSSDGIAVSVLSKQYVTGSPPPPLVVEGGSGK